MEKVKQGYQSLSHSKWDCRCHIVLIPQKASESIVWVSAAPFREDFPCAGPAERMPDFGRAFSSGSCSYVYRDSPEASGGLGDWIPERKERHRGGSGVWRQGAQFHRGAPLGLGIRGIHCWF